MNKLMTKISGLLLGLAMAFGVAAGISMKGASRVDADSFTLTLDSNHSGPWGTSGYGSGNGSTTEKNNGVSINLTWVNVYKNSSCIQIKSNTSNCFYSTNCPFSYITSIKIKNDTYSANLYMSVDGSDWTELSYTSNTALSFTSEKNYKYFKISATSSYVKLSSVIVTYYGEPEIPTSINSIVEKPNYIYQNENINSEDVLINATFSNGSKDIHPNHVNVDSSAVANEVTATAWITESESGTLYIEFSINVLKTPYKAYLSSFNSISGNLGENVSYNFTKDNGTTNPTTYNKSDNTKTVKMYKPSSGKTTGTKLSVSCANGYTLKKVVLKSDKQNALKYVINTSSLENLNTKSLSDNPIVEQYLVDDINSNSIYIYNILNDTVQVSYLYVEYYQDEVLTPTKLIVSWKENKGQYYNGNIKTSEFSTNDLNVLVVDGNKDKTVTSLTNGIGFSVSFLDYQLVATEEIVTQSLTGIDEGTYSIKIEVTINETTKFSDESLTLKIIQKNPEENTFTWDSEPNTEFISHFDSLSIKGKPKVLFNDTSKAISNELMRFDLFTNENFESKPIFSMIDTNSTQDSNRVYNQLISENGLIANSGVSMINQTTTLCYANETTLFYKLTLLNYSSNNVLSGSINIYPVSLEAIDETEQTYYVGGSYNMSALVSASYNNKNFDVDSDEIIVNDGKAFEPTTAGIHNVTVWLKNDSTISTTYEVEVKNPLSLSKLEILLNDYKAGDPFSIDSIVLTFSDNSIENLNIQDPNVVYKISTENSIENASVILLGTPIRKTMVYSYVFATVTIGNQSISSDGDRIENVADGVVNETPQFVNTWSRVTSVDTLLDGGKFIIGYEDNSQSPGVITPMQNIGSMSTSSTGYVYSGNDSSTSTKSTIDINKLTDYSKYIVNIGKSSITNTNIYIQLGDNYLGNNNTKNNCQLFTTQSASTSFAATYNSEGKTFSLKLSKNSSYHTLQYNSGSPRFAVYGGTQKDVVIFKLSKSVNADDAAIFIKSFVDMIRLNNETASNNASICDADTSIYSNEKWDDLKTIFASLENADELLNEQDKYGETGKTYFDTVSRLIQKEAIQNNVGLNIMKTISNTKNLTIIIVCLLSLISVGFYFVIRRRKEY